MKFHVRYLCAEVWPLRMITWAEVKEKSGLQRGRGRLLLSRHDRVHAGSLIPKARPSPSPSLLKTFGRYAGIVITGRGIKFPNVRMGDPDPGRLSAASPTMIVPSAEIAWAAVLKASEVCVKYLDDWPADSIAIPNECAPIIDVRTDDEAATIRHRFRLHLLGERTEILQHARPDQIAKRMSARVAIGTADDDPAHPPRRFQRARNDFPVETRPGISAPMAIGIQPARDAIRKNVSKVHRGPWGGGLGCGAAGPVKHGQVWHFNICCPRVNDPIAESSMGRWSELLRTNPPGGNGAA